MWYRGHHIRTLIASHRKGSPTHTFKTVGEPFCGEEKNGRYFSRVRAPDLNLVTSKEFEEGTVKAFDWIKVLAMARRKYLKQVFASI